MKKIAIIFLVIFYFPGFAWGQDYLHYTIEQVSFTPESYLGLTVFFDGAQFQPSLYKETKFGDVKYGIDVQSKGGFYYFDGFYYMNITFYVAPGFAAQIVNLQISSGYHKANLTCTIEKTTALYYDGTTKPYWLAKVLKIEMFDYAGNAANVMVDETAPQPIDPVGDAIKAERARWDANGDNKIGIEEAIRALQIVSGMR